MTTSAGSLEPPARIILSYARADGAGLASDIMVELNIRGLTYWQDRRDLVGDADWRRQFERVLRASRSHLVLVLTAGALISGQCAWEWRLARRLGSQVSPVWHGSAEFSGLRMPRWMQRTHKYHFAIPEERERLLATLAAEPSPRRVPDPALSQDLSGQVKRPALMAELRRALLDDDGELVPATVVLYGGPGYGKTSLAEQIVLDENMREEAFFDGVLWVQLGERRINAKSVLSGLVQELIGGNEPRFRTVTAARDAFAVSLNGRCCLLVLDDAWRHEDLESFLYTGPEDSTARLITTRVKSILSDVTRAKGLAVKELTGDEALELLALDLDPAEVAREEPRLRELAEHRLGRWPLLIDLVRGQLERRLKLGQPLPAVLEDVDRELEQQDVRIKGYRYTNKRRDIRATLELSLKLLTPTWRRRYIELAVFAEDADVTLASVSRLWGTDPWETRKVCDDLFELSLIRDLDLRSEVMRLHDAIRHVLIRMIGKAELRRLHARFVAAWQAECGTDWRTLTDGYALRYLPWHLDALRSIRALARHAPVAKPKRSVRGSGADALLLDPRWIAAKLSALGIMPVLSDYLEFAGGPGSATQLVGRALHLAAEALTTERAELTGQLLGRLGQTDAEGLGAMLAVARAVSQPDVLLPCRPSLTPPGTELRRFDCDDDVLTVAWLSDGSTVSGSKEGWLRLRDGESGRLLHSVRAHSGPVWRVGVLTDDRVVSGGKDGTIRIWDPFSGREPRRLIGHVGGVLSVAVTTNGKIVSGGDDCTVRLWDADDEREVDCFVGHEKRVLSVGIMPDGRVLSGSTDRTVRLWDPNGNPRARRFVGHAGSVETVAGLPGGRFVSGGADGVLIWWDAKSGRELDRRVGHPGGVWSVNTLPKGLIASGGQDSTVRVWDMHTLEERRCLRGHEGPVLSVGARPDGRIASAALDRSVRLWEVEGGHDLVRPRTHVGAVRSVAELPNGLLLSGGQDTTLRVWHLASGRELRRFEGHGHPVRGLAVLPDGHVVSASAGNALVVWDLESGRECYRLHGHEGQVNCILLLPDNRLVSGSDDGTLRLWELSKRREQRCFAAHRGWVWSVALLSDGHLASAHEDEAVMLWSEEYAQAIDCLKGHKGFLRSVVGLPDGSIVSGGQDSVLRVWKPNQRRQPKLLEGHAGRVRCLAALSGDRVVSASQDRTLRVWGIEEGRHICRFSLDGVVTAVITTRDGRIVAGDQLGRIHLLETTS